MDKTDPSGVWQRYRAMVGDGALQADPAQERLARRLDELLDDLKRKRSSSKSSALGWLFAKRRSETRKPDIKGLYIHGDVGRGKTMLMDMFYRAAPLRRKRRVHFNDFMADVHARINGHRSALKRGEVKEDDPIPPVAAALRDEAWLLCFDEFTVTDIADAMILSRLFKQLFERGCILVATSNVEPDALYKDGLNRQLFLPFVDLLRAHVEIVDLDARTDYRLERLERQPVYLHPCDARAQAIFEKNWRTETGGQRVHADTIDHRGRTIDIPKAAGGAARFQFRELIGNAYGASDYRAIAERYDVLFVEDVPVLASVRRNEIKRFILLIDTLYDLGRRIVICAEAAAGDLYPERKGTEGFEFDRTVSRLIEMQSSDYLKRAEKPDVQTGESDEEKPAKYA